jgi:hypothetical protein
MAKCSAVSRRCVVASMLSLCLLPLVALHSNSQIRLSPEPLTRQQEYLLGSYGLYDRDGLHLLLYNDSQEPLTVIIVLEGEGIDIDSAGNTVKLTSRSPQIHLGVSQGFFAANPYPSEMYELYPYAYDDQSFQSTFVPIGEFRYPKIEWKIAIRKSEQIELVSITVVGELTVRPQYDPNPPSPEELSLMSGQSSPNLKPFLIRSMVTVSPTGQ